MTSAERVPIRWRTAGALRTLPEFRGRDRIEGLILGNSEPPAGLHEGTFGPGLRFSVCYRDDTHLAAFYFLRFEPPALASILSHILTDGDVFLDVGANVGVYSGWAARLVGPSGSVHAFEPVPQTLEYLRAFLALNELAHVTVAPVAVGSAVGELSLTVVPHHSGISSAASQADVGPMETSVHADEISVKVTTLDEYVSERGLLAVNLVKIDVEGWEFEVMRGADRLLSGPVGPAILFESQPDMLRSAGTSLGRIVEWLANRGYATYALGQRGLRLLAAGLHDDEISTNALALHEGRHADIYHRLASVRFRRNQTC